MWIVQIDDNVVAVYKSPVAAELYADELQHRGLDATVFYDEGGR